MALIRKATPAAVSGTVMNPQDEGKPPTAKSVTLKGKAKLRKPIAKKGPGGGLAVPQPTMPSTFNVDQ